LQESSVHATASSQSTGAPATQAPAEHASGPLQKRPSSHSASPEQAPRLRISRLIVAQSVVPSNEPSTGTVDGVAISRSCAATEAASPPLPAMTSARSVYPAPGTCMWLRMAAAPQAMEPAAPTDTSNA
jgi:hypothetical protein